MSKKIKSTLKKIPVTLVFEELPDNRILGLRINWLTGKHKKKTFTVDTGAGCGNPGLSFTYKDKSYSVSIQDILPQLIKEIDK